MTFENFYYDFPYFLGKYYPYTSCWKIPHCPFKCQINKNWVQPRKISKMYLHQGKIPRSRKKNWLFVLDRGILQSSRGILRSGPKTMIEGSRCCKHSKRSKHSQFSKTPLFLFRSNIKIKGVFVQTHFLKCSPTLWVLILRYDVRASLTSRMIWVFHSPSWRSSWNWRKFIFDN